MTDTEITTDPSNLALTDDISIPTIGDNSDTNPVEYTDLADIIRHALLSIKAFDHNVMKETINFLVLFVIKTAMKISNLFTAHSVITGYIANVMAHQKLNSTSYLMNLMMYHFIVFYALFTIMQRFIHLVIYQHLKC